MLNSTYPNGFHTLFKQIQISLGWCKLYTLSASLFCAHGLIGGAECCSYNYKKMLTIFLHSSRVMQKLMLQIYKSMYIPLYTCYAPEAAIPFRIVTGFRKISPNVTFQASNIYKHNEEWELPITFIIIKICSSHLQLPEVNVKYFKTSVTLLLMSL